ncbi:hypothetical protein NDU88_009608 [Pleurodeles waltl]|uniref:Uncharacterized protein n=1 Tax=Pleurodeles waltl TaxID=8319 RepID=A0AAV7QXT4_PLEWA|nr:hypothetical protein NDU88_009608 [Pleurodeles waltl]
MNREFIGASKGRRRDKDPEGSHNALSSPQSSAPSAPQDVRPVELLHWHPSSGRARGPRCPRVGDCNLCFCREERREPLLGDHAEDSREAEEGSAQAGTEVPTRPEL